MISVQGRGPGSQYIGAGAKSVGPQLNLPPYLTTIPCSYGVPLVGVLHEKLGAADFQPFLAGPLYYDPDKIFFGPKQRRLGLLGFLRLDVWMNIYRYYNLGQFLNDLTFNNLLILQVSEGGRQ